MDVDEIIKDDKAKYPIFLKLKAKQLINDNINLKDKINNSENHLNEYKKILKNLVSYLTMKKAKNNIIELQNKINENKMIII